MAERNPSPPGKKTRLIRVWHRCRPPGIIAGKTLAMWYPVLSNQKGVRVDVMGPSRVCIRKRRLAHDTPTPTQAKWSLNLHRPGRAFAILERASPMLDGFRTTHYLREGRWPVRSVAKGFGLESFHLPRKPGQLCTKSASGSESARASNRLRAGPSSRGSERAGASCRRVIGGGARTSLEFSGRFSGALARNSTWDPLRSTGRTPDINLHLKSAPETNSKAISRGICGVTLVPELVGP